MADDVLVDTSVWVDLFRAGSAKKEIERLIRERRAVYCGLIAAELLRGARGPEELDVLEKLFNTLNYLEETRETLDRAGRLGYALARKGLNLATIDLVIAQLCLDRQLALFTYDKHFKQIAMATKLELFSG